MKLKKRIRGNRINSKKYSEKIIDENQEFIILLYYEH